MSKQKNATAIMLDRDSENYKVNSLEKHKYWSEEIEKLKKHIHELPPAKQSELRKKIALLEEEQAKLKHAVDEFGSTGMDTLEHIRKEIKDSVDKLQNIFSN